MSKQDKQEPINQQSVIEDKTVNEKQVDESKSSLSNPTGVFVDSTGTLW
ncbi:MAG TPA: hypothetical protein VJX74_05525 [Blastocatellia bacterium]|nr:hypothetical protein [Blastocatellia bacterium]